MDIKISKLYCPHDAIKAIKAIYCVCIYC